MKYECVDYEGEQNKKIEEFKEEKRGRKAKCDKGSEPGRESRDDGVLEK